MVDHPRDPSDGEGPRRPKEAPANRAARVRRRDILASAAAAPVAVLIAVVAGILTIQPPPTFEAALDRIAVADEDHRHAAQTIVLAEGAEAVSPLAEIVAREGPPRDVAAAVLIGWLGRRGVDTAGAFGELEAALREGRPELSRAAAAALATSRSDGGLEILLGVLQDAPDPERRRAAADALGEARVGRAVRALLGSWDDPELAVRARAALWGIVGAAPPLGADPAERERWWREFADDLPPQLERPR